MQPVEKKSKVLLMGKRCSGKTSMRAIIFANFMARETQKFAFTNDVQSSKIKFLGNLYLDLWDCGGQDLFMEQYFGARREQIFKDTVVLIYVFDVTSREIEPDMKNYSNAVQALQEFSKDASIYILVHKMDTIKESDKAAIIEQKKALIKEKTVGFNYQLFFTSIWDETLYQAWSQIAHGMIPKISMIEKGLNQLCTLSKEAPNSPHSFPKFQIGGADEIVLFEKSTFLEVSHIASKPHKDPHRFEKISNIIKQFKLSLLTTTYLFQEMMVKNSKFCAYLIDFTNATYLMVILSNHEIEESALKLNIDALKPVYSKIINASVA